MFPCYLICDTFTVSLSHSRQSPGSPSELFPSSVLSKERSTWKGIPVFTPPTVGTVFLISTPLSLLLFTPPVTCFTAGYEMPFSKPLPVLSPVEQVTALQDGEATQYLPHVLDFYTAIPLMGVT